MRSWIGVALALLMLVSNSAQSADSRVRGHVTKSGTYVPPHQRTMPDKSKANNYSSKGNTNPYTGKPGTVEPYSPHSLKPRK